MSMSGPRFIQIVFYIFIIIPIISLKQTHLILATSITWTRTPDPDPGPWTLNPDPDSWIRTLKAWTLKNLDLEKHGKRLDMEK